MYPLLEYSACLILVATVSILLFAVCALFTVIQEGVGEILGRLAHGIAREARVLVAREKGQTLCRHVQSQGK
jgi:hypothetical protein